MTSKEINNPISGFYYDQQLDNKMTKVSLHASTKLVGDKWEDIGGTKFEEDNFYSKTPLCESLIMEDFQVSIANTYNEFGGDPLGQLWNSAVKPISPYLSYVKDDLATIASKSKEFVNKYLDNNKDSNNFIKKGIANVATGVTGIIDEAFGSGKYEDIIDYTNRNLIVQGTMFSYYAGTGVDFGTLSMKFVVFSGYDKMGKYKTVEKQIQDLKPYVAGHFVPVKEAGDLAKEFAYWQIPPGGIRNNIKNIDTSVFGSLKLLIGPYYAIENLAISSAQFNYSKAFCKVPDYPQNNDGNLLDPLYCEVTLNLKAITKFSDDRVFDFAHGKRNTTYRKDFEQEINKSLDTIKGRTGSPSSIKKM